MRKAALNVLLDLLPGCVYTVAADLCLQPCRKEPLLKTNGITFQWSWCQVLETRATFDNFTQSKPADSPQVREECGESLPTGSGSQLRVLAQCLGNQTLLCLTLTTAGAFPGTQPNRVSNSADLTYRVLSFQHIFKSES